MSKALAKRKRQCVGCQRDGYITHTRSEKVISTPFTEKWSVKQRRAKQNAFIEALRVTGSISAACRQIKVPHQTIYKWIESDELFKALVEDAKLQAKGRLEQELMNRAVDGEWKPVVSAGKLVTYELKKSDDLLKVALRAADPEKYSDKGRQIGAKMGVDKDGNKFFKVYEGFDPDEV